MKIPRIQHVAVIGSGNMGRQLAAMLANTGVRVELLDIVPDGAGEHRKMLAEEALKELPKITPPPLADDAAMDLIRPGNLEDHWDRVVNSDWILEAVVERVDIKRQLFEKIDTPNLKAHWVTSNTSGLSIQALTDGRSPQFQRRFFGTHFFNPPRYLPLVEIVPHTGTDPEHAMILVQWLIHQVGKRPVWVKDTPNFIANRMGIFQTLATFHLMEKFGLSVEEIDALTGPLVGRPKSATFQTLDLVGLDIFAAALKTLRDRATNDEFYDWFRMPPWLEQLMADGALGRKTNRGVYWKKGDELFVFNPAKNEYSPRRKPQYPWSGRIKAEESLAGRLAVLQRQDKRLADFVLRVLGYPSLYAARRIPEVADTIVNIDNAMRWGFQLRWGPFQVWDQLGFETILSLEAELPPAQAPLVETMKSSRNRKFYKINGQPQYFHLPTASYQPSTDLSPWTPQEWIRLHHKPVVANAEASLYDTGDGIYTLFWHSPTNAIGIEILEMVQRSLEFVADHGIGMIIMGTGEHFSYGANLGLLAMALQNRDIAQLDWTIRTFQTMTKSLRIAPFPVVTAVYGMVLGGGCEFMMHADFVVASVESYIGLVELGAGLIPAGGGCAEIVRRSNLNLDMKDRVTPWVHLQDRLGEFFQHVAQAQVSRSAFEARRWGFLKPEDRIVMDSHQLLETARTLIMEVAPGYRPPVESPVWVPGKDGFAQFMFVVHSLHRGGYITDYERFLGEHLAHVLTGGDLPHPTQVSLDYIRDLERDTFLQLCKERKTYERIAHIIGLGKPIRN